MTKIKEKSEEGRKINFKNIEIKDLSGHVDIFDISKLLGNFIYKTTADLGMFEAARLIYNDGEIFIKPVPGMDQQGKMIITEPIKDGLLQSLYDARCPFTALVKSKLIEMIEGKTKK